MGTSVLMTIKHVTGDLFSLNVQAIGHGVNCKGVMGSGIAVEFKRRHQIMFEHYRQICERNLLQLGQVMVWRPSDAPVIFNVASQYEPGPNADMEGLLIGLDWVEFYSRRNGIETVGLPQIGCGIGGLDWDEVSSAIEILLGPAKTEFTLVTYAPN